MGVPRADLLSMLWGDADDARVGGCFNTLVTDVRKDLRDALGDASPILNGDGCYRLNRAAGVGVDVDWFDLLVDQGHRAHAASDEVAARVAYEAALDEYGGDLYIGRGEWDEVHAFVEQERLRSRCLTALGRAADLAGRVGDHERAMAHARRLLAMDPCSELGHRLVMHIYALRSQRAQALRQYRVCAEALRREYDAEPEPATVALFELIRRGAWTASAGCGLIGS